VSTTAPPATATTAPRAVTATTFASRLTQAQYEQYVLACVYGFGTGEDRECERLEAAGHAKANNYGLGNSMAQAPLAPLRQDCLASIAGSKQFPFSCAELSKRVDEKSPDSKTLTCFFFKAVVDESSPLRPIDAIHLATLLRESRAPAAVVAAATAMESGSRTAAGVASLKSHLGSTCA
jgi:hypothetical protein